MDKETLSNYGWIVICILVMVVMIALASPFGNFISGAIKSTTAGLFGVNQNALGAAGIDVNDNYFVDADWEGIEVHNEDELLRAVKTGGKIKFMNDISLTNTITVSNDIMLNTNGCRLSADAEIAVIDIIGGNVALDGNGTIENTLTSGSNNYAVLIQNNGKLTVNDATLIGDESAVYVKSGEAVINGGFFEAHGATSPVPNYKKTWDGVTYTCYLASVINCSKSSYNNFYWGRDGEKANVDIYGGTFVNEDPSYLFEGDFVELTHVVDGYKVIREEQANGDAWYTVVPE